MWLWAHELLEPCGGEEYVAIMDRRRNRQIKTAVLLSGVCLLAAQVSGSSALAAAAKKKSKTTTTRKKTSAAPAPGRACSPAGVRAPGTTLDCVKVASGLQWQPRGARSNPFRFNEVGEYTAYDSNRYRIKVTGMTVLTVEEIKPGGVGKYAIPAGYVPVQVIGELTYLGPKDTNDLPASITSLVLVDASGKKFDTYAGDDKAGGECSQFGDVDQNHTRSLARDDPHTTPLCVVVPSASIGPSLLLNLSWVNEPNGIWFKTSV